MGNATAEQIAPIAGILLGIFAAAALVAIAVAAARHFLRKGEDAAAPSGIGSRVSHVIGYIFAGGLIAGAGASIATLGKDAGGEDAIQSAASQTGRPSKNPFAPTGSTGLEPIAGKRSEEAEAASRAIKRIQAEADRDRKKQEKQALLKKLKGATSAADGIDVEPIEDDETARKLLSPSDYLKYASGIRFVAITASDGSCLIRPVD